MLNKLLSLLIFANTINCFTQVSSYSGFIDKYPITLTAHNYSDGFSNAVYVYDKYDTPIRINGINENDLVELYERDQNNNIKATLRFENFNKEDKELSGLWVNQDSTKKLNISLKKDFEINPEKDYGKDIEWGKVEIIQSASTKDHYFKLLVSKTKGVYSPRVSGVKIIEKKTDRLIQIIELDCELWMLNNISVEDYNFDGIEDFSVFESSYFGPNTTSIYILREPGSEQYFVSDFEGVSLEFNQGSQTIFEHNQCCAGRSHMTATYNVVDNKMVMIEQNCIEYDEEKEDFIDVECD